MLEPRIVATSVSRLIDADRPRWADEFVPALLACGPGWVVVRRLIAPACSDGRRSAISSRAAPHHSSVLLEATAVQRSRHSSSTRPRTSRRRHVPGPAAGLTSSYGPPLHRSTGRAG